MERNPRTEKPEEMSGFKFDYECCEKFCKSKAELTIHRRRLHERSEIKITFKCQLCTQEFEA